MSVGKIKIFSILLLLLGISACTPITKIEQPQISDWIKLSKTQSIGQTFTARYNGLEGIEINVNPDKLKKGKIILHLRHDPRESTDIATSEIQISRFSKSNSYKLKFSPQNQSLNHDYYITLELIGDSLLSVAIAPGDSYQNGALYCNNEPLDNQLWFNLVYNRKLALLGIIIEILGWIKYLAVGFFLFIIPGWGFLLFLDQRWTDKYWYEKIGLSAGLSLAVYPILFLWTHIIGLNLGAIYAWLPPLIGITIILWKKYREIIGFRFSLNKIKRAKITDILLLIITAMIIFVRLWAIRNLPAPMWGDGFQHTVISQLLVDNKGLFNSWQPYAEIASFTYHFGFHTLVAVFHWITGISLPQATLWTGQILNILAVLCLIPLVNKINKNPWGSIFCIFLAGLISPMPMYYLNWGRYTQLAGQIILIACVYYAWECFDNKYNWQLFFINCLIMGGLALTHYRVLFFALCFYLSYFLFNFRFNFKNTTKSILIIGIGSLVIFFPWLVHVFEGKLPAIQSATLSTPANDLSQSSIIVDSIGDISFYLQYFLWIFSILVFIWGIFKRNIAIMTISFWWICFLVIANPQWLRLPGTGVITNFAVFIAAYIPTIILLGGAIGLIIDLLTDIFDNNYPNIIIFKYSLIKCVLSMLLLFFSVYSIKNTLNLIDTKYFALITKPDLKAMTWINRNISNDSIFIVNSFLAYNDTTAVGSDGGWWLPYLSSRNSILPPINYATEKNQNPNFIKVVSELTSTVQENGITSDEVWNLLLNNRITHIYIGQKHGKVNNSGPTINFDDLSKDPRFKEIYHIDRVWIFELIK